MSASDKSTPANTSSAGDGSAGQASVFDAKEGSIGKQFTTEGAIGGTAQKIGGPLAADGAIGKNFTTEGAIGGTAQEKLADKK
ncbi:hypothetical protein AC579_5734 [Pseudocercospora musae]|uniref:Uncharacterized protein n=1 Tax=Pseudocercospora musae TaxID=113226 RepID=A0A139IRL2_9PEZI|nr:hypothetical protein AC579_5734 [Pseudocercospora musae]